MGIKILEKEGYKFSVIGSLLTLGMGVIALILTFVLYEVEGISIGETQILQLTVIVVGGIIVPGILFALNFLADRQILKFKLAPFIFGLVTVVLGVLIIVVSAISADFMITFIEDFSPELPAPVTITALLYLAIITMVVCTYGGIQSILAHLKNE